MKVAIVGGSEVTRDLAPYDDPSWQIWGMQNRMSQYKRYDLLFEVHSPKHFPTKKSAKGYFDLFGFQLEYIRKQGKLVDHKNYPYKEAIDLRGRWTLQNAACYMMAYAILKGATEIALYGVDLVDNHEYINQRPFVDGWIGFAEGKGIKVTWPENSALNHIPYKYGIEPFTGKKYQGQKATPVAKMLLHAIKQCETALDKYKDFPDICNQAQVELNCYASVLSRLREAERGRDITKAIQIPFDDIDRHIAQYIKGTPAEITPE